MQRIANAHDTELASFLTKLKTGGFILIWVTGLILAGSDGPLMPYVNVFGAIVFAGACLGLCRQARQPGPDKSKDGIRQKRCLGLPGYPQALGQNRGAICAANHLESLPNRPRYARELGVV
jgi:hypothetical protein